MGKQTAKSPRSDQPDKYELLVVIGTRKLYRLVRPAVLQAARRLRTLMRSASRTLHGALSPRQLFSFSRRHGVLFYILAACWAWLLVQATALVREVHHSDFAAYPRDNLITSGSIRPSFSLAADFGQLAALLGIGLLLALAIFAIRKSHWRKAAAGIQLAVIIAGVLFMQATTMYGNDRVTAEMNAIPSPPSLSQVIVQRAECGDAIRMVDSYNFAAKTFYALQDQGYRLAATFDSQTGNLDSTAACRTYYSIRAQHPADHIVVQLFTRASDGTLLPYTYTEENMENHLGINGIFVKP